MNCSLYDGAASSSSSRTQSCESEYLSAGSRLLSAACIPQPKLIIHYKAVNPSQEQVFTLDISSARSWLRHNHLWANDVWVHWAKLLSPHVHRSHDWLRCTRTYTYVHITFLFQTVYVPETSVDSGKHNQWNQENGCLDGAFLLAARLMVMFQFSFWLRSRKSQPKTDARTVHCYFAKLVTHFCSYLF